ncbi:MAG: Asp-tRNA(Asn)/Glu-tRNA(Gln) amidotransferase subunit GatB [bacterium]|nr:Asp-tRNA(Asn)/Glu-tRNA(Gln) amidotransferase subunit GatB [bacterium]
MNELTPYQTIIGLEVHAQLKTDSKLFCGCHWQFGAQPNARTCPLCLGLPGALPVLNRKAVEFAIKLALAVEARIAQRTAFSRKNYFYPDLPKGYQILQFDSPIASSGKLKIRLNSGIKTIQIRRIHLEDDAGKSIHAESWVRENESLIDFNRCGVPLIEIVTEPELSTPGEASRFLQTIRQLLRYLDICDANMEVGNLRCDANISVRPPGAIWPGVKTEVKNLNSFRAVERALAYEQQRQIELLEHGEKILSDTLLWNEKAQVTESMRIKEQAHDYRYFPEPDLPSLKIDTSWLDKIQNEMPELPDARRERFIRQYKLSRADADLFTTTVELADFFEKVVVRIGDVRLVNTWVKTELLRSVNQSADEATPISADAFAELLDFVKQKKITAQSAKIVLVEMLTSEKAAAEIIRDKKLTLLSDANQLGVIVDQVIADNPDAVKHYRSGKRQLLNFFMGQVMRLTRTKADPGVVKKLLFEKLNAG